MEFTAWLPWQGRELHNNLHNLPSSEQRRIIEILTQKTKRTALKKCLVPGICEGKTVEGHSVPRSLMRKMTAGAMVMSFINQPLNGKKNFLPSAQSINHALTGYFTCEKHDAMFMPIEREIPDFNNPKHLNLIAYKAILKAMWSKHLMRDAFESLAKEDSKSEWPSCMVYLFTEMETKIGYYKRIAEQTLGIAEHTSTYGGKPQDCLNHKIIRVPSEQRAIAVCSWSNGLPYEYDPQSLSPLSISQSGCTVYPLENEHVVVYHYTDSDAPGVNMTNRLLYKASGKLLQQRMSRDILRYCEDIVIAPEVWQAFSTEKKQAIKDYFLATIPNVGLYSPDAPAVIPEDSWHSKRLRLINLFG